VVEAVDVALGEEAAVRVDHDVAVVGGAPSRKKSPTSPFSQKP
jgi:hypothetical protein